MESVADLCLGVRFGRDLVNLVVELLSQVAPHVAEAAVLCPKCQDPLLWHDPKGAHFSQITCRIRPEDSPDRFRKAVDQELLVELLHVQCEYGLPDEVFGGWTGFMQERAGELFLCVAVTQQYA